MIVGWVHHETTEKVRPGEVLHRILLVFDSSSRNLGIHMIVKHIAQRGLDWKWFIKELFVEVFFGAWTNTHATPLSSNCGRPARPIICSTSVIGKSTYRPDFPSKNSVPLTTTSRAGKLTPHARVEVETKT